MAIALGPYTFDARTDSDSDSFLYTDPLATDATIPQTANTARRWCHDTNDTTSTGVGPTSGAGGSPDGYLYTEASSPAAFDDEFLLELDVTLDAAANKDVTVKWKTNQRGTDNNTTCQLQTKEGAGAWTDRGTLFGGSGDADKVATSGTQIWSQRSVDISALGVNNATTRVRLKLVFPASGTAWHNDYGIDEVEVTGVTIPPVEQEGFRFRNDDGSESAATWAAAQDIDVTKQKETAVRLRVLSDVTGDADTAQATLQYKRDTDAATEWRDV